MAEPSTRRRSPVSRGPKVPQGPLGQKARRLQELALQLRDQRTTERHLQELQTRRDEFRKIATELSRLADTARILRAAMGVPPRPPDVSTAREEIATLQARDWGQIGAAAERVPATLRKPLAALESSLRDGWKSFAAPDPRAALFVPLLARLDRRTDARSRIQAILDELAAEAERLPDSQDAPDRVRTCQQTLVSELDALEKSGLDEEVLRFCQEAMAGAPLARLLDNASLLERLRKYKLLEHFTLVLRSSAKPDTR